MFYFCSTLPGRMVVGENGAASTLPMRDHKNGATPIPQKGDRFAGCKCTLLRDKMNCTVGKVFL